jgi:hypothetical protein
MAEQRMKSAVVVTALLIGASGCSTLHFDNGDASTEYTYREWHHNGILDLVEFSSPVDMRARCGGDDWQSVKVEKSFTNGLADAISYNFYDGWTVEYHCDD